VYDRQVRSSAAALGAPERDSKRSRYELLAELAAGATGTIYRAHDPLARREVALKRLRVPSGSDRAQLTVLFQREFGALMRLPHPNIVEVYDYGFDESGPYYTMELLPGGDLTGAAPMQLGSACRVLRDVASALALVHTRKLLHRDVSPRNVHLAEDGRVKLIDFGGLMPFGKPHDVVGTPAFMAPECLSGGALDQRIDLYSLGAVAYWLLTGRLSRSASSLDDMLCGEEPPAPPSEFVPNIPRELDALVLALLSDEPLARPASAADVIDRLTSIADLEPERDERLVAYSYLEQPPLVGRAALVATLEQAVREASLGQGRTVLVEATPGLGRSALLDHAELAAQLAGVTVLRAEGVSASPPFSLARRLLELATTLHPTSTERLPVLDTIFPLDPAAPRGAVERAKGRARALELTESCLLELSEKHPLLVVVDDLHTVDAESLALLAALTEHVPDQSLSLIVASAAGETATDVHAYATLRKRAAREQLVPLAEADCVALLAGIFGGVPHSHRLGVWLHAQSGGNPGKCLSLLRLLLQRQAIRYTVGTFTLPHDVSDDFGIGELDSPLSAALAETSAVARGLAHALALHDGALTVRQLAAVDGLPTYEILPALRELTRRAIVRRVVDGFVLDDHALRAALEDALDAEQARALHVRLGHALMASSRVSLDGRLSATQHLLRGGRELEAEQLLEPVTSDMLLLASSAARAIAVLEAMLASARARGHSDQACLRWLIPMVSLGFFGDRETQQRHLDHTLAELSKLCGMTLAARLRPWLGPRLALIFGLLYAAICRRLRPATQELGTLRELLTSLVSIVMSGVAAGASSFDPDAAGRLLGWLEPLSALPPQSGAYLIRECCRATAELGAGTFDASAARYAQILDTLAQQPRQLRGFDAAAQRALYYGCLNGRAQAEVANCSPVALELADVLAREASIFFAPHPECTRMSYFAQRGEVDRAESHRLRAEQLALQGGTSWAFVTVLAARWAYAACQTRDAIRLVRAIAELDRLVATAPNLALIKQSCEAWLEFLRGKVERSIALFERVIDDPTARKLPTRRLDQLMFATVLNVAGHHGRARTVCRAIEAQGELVTNLRDAQLALADAGLGKLSEAADLLDATIARATRGDNPLELGNAHRDRARVALLALDGRRFEQHLKAMSEQFRKTRNPSLIQQRDLLVAAAVRCGVRPPQRLGSRPSVPAIDPLDGAIVDDDRPSDTPRTLADD